MKNLMVGNFLGHPVEVQTRATDGQTTY